MRISDWSSDVCSSDLVDGKSYKLKVVYYDDESTPARGAQLAERLIRQDGVQYMLGPYSSGMTKAIAPVTEKYQIPMVQAEGASRSLFTQGYKYMFRILPTSQLYRSEERRVGKWWDRTDNMWWLA